MPKSLKESLFENILHILQLAQPNGWQKLLLYGEVDEEQCYSFFYSYPKGVAKPIFCNDLPEKENMDPEQLADLLDELDDCLISLWEEVESLGEDPWTTVTITFDENGAHRAHYLKADLKKGNVETRRKVWEKENLK